MAGLRVLYLTYDGVLEPLGQSQILNYVERLASDYSITLLSFEKASDAADHTRMGEMRRRLRSRGIEWIALTYHKQPPLVSTAYDIAAGIRRARQLSAAGAPAIVHARSYVPSVIALAVKRATGAQFLFDMRGFWVDEKVEAGSWPKDGLIYRVGKWFERRFLAAADGIVSLTHEGARYLPELGLDPRRGAAVSVIPTCVDTARFAPGSKDQARLHALGLSGSRVVGCIGTMTNRYLREDTLRYLGMLAQQIDNVKVLIVTRDDHEQLARDATAANLDASKLVLTSAAFTDMPDMVRLLDVGVFFMKPFFAQKASAATKMGEMLACGIPLIVNDGVADSSAIVRDERLGIVLPDTADATLKQSVGDVVALWKDGELAARCRAAAMRLFDVEIGTERYRALYEQLASRGRESRRPA